MQCKLNQNPSKLFYEYQHTDSKVYKEKQKPQNNQHNIKGEEQSGRLTPSEFKTTQDSAVLVKE